MIEEVVGLNNESRSRIKSQALRSKWLKGGQRLILSTLAILASLTWAKVASAQGCDPESPSFVLGFSDFKSQLGPVMGDPKECERPNPENGDSLQLTTTGLAFYDKGANTAKFYNALTGTSYALTAEGLKIWQGDATNMPEDTSPAVEEPAITDQPPTQIPNLPYYLTRETETRPYETLTAEDSQPKNIYLGRKDILVPILEVPADRQQLIKDAYEFLGGHPKFDQLRNTITGIDFVRNVEVNRDLFVLNDQFGRGAALLLDSSEYAYLVRRDELAAWILNQYLIAEAAQKGDWAERYETVPLLNTLESVDAMKQEMSQVKIRLMAARGTLDHLITHQGNPFVISRYTQVISGNSGRLETLKAELANLLSTS